MHSLADLAHWAAVRGEHDLAKICAAYVALQTSQASTTESPAPGVPPSTGAGPFGIDGAGI